MNYGVQFKVRGDDFGGHFINGISMADSESIWKCRLVSADDEKNVYESQDGYKITAYHIAKGDVTECYTVFENNTDKTVSTFSRITVCVDTMQKLLTQNLCTGGFLLLQKLWE